jgi:hypothetical protein
VTTKTTPNWAWARRRELALVVALLTLCALLVLTLILLTVETALRKQRERLFSQAVLRQLTAGISTTWRKLRGTPKPGWHPCAQCYAPIEPPSRAAYCSPSCRRRGCLQRRAQEGDERARLRLERLQRQTHDPALAEIPF